MGFIINIVNSFNKNNEPNKKENIVEFNEDTRKHMEFIQSVITRMNTNSFQIKGMTITIAAALVALYASTKNALFIFIPILPTLLFWFLDSYYLQQERKFRGVYNDVAGLKHNVQVKPYEMPINKYIGGEYSFACVFWSRTIWPLYLTIILILSVLGFGILNEWIVVTAQISS